MVQKLLYLYWFFFNWEQGLGNTAYVPDTGSLMCIVLLEPGINFTPFEKGDEISDDPFTTTRKMLGTSSNFQCFVLLHITKHHTKRKTEQKENQEEQLSQIKKMYSFTYDTA